MHTVNGRRMGRIMSLGFAGVALSFAGLARATVIHTQIVGLAPGLVTMPSDQTEPPPPATLFQGLTAVTGSFTVPPEVLANPLLNAVKVELVASYQFGGTLGFFEPGELLLEVFGSAKAACLAGGETDIVFAGPYFVPPYDGTQMFVRTNGPGFQTIPISMNHTYGRVSEPYEVGSPEFTALTSNSNITWKVDFYFDVFATELTSFTAIPQGV